MRSYDTIGLLFEVLSDILKGDEAVGVCHLHRVLQVDVAVPRAHFALGLMLG